MADAPFVSYAQHGEDVVLWRALGGRDGVTYVDVGAFHPSDDSVTRALYERGWRGVNIEAQPDRLAAFEEQRPQDTNLAVAIGDEDGTVTLTLPGNPGWASTLSPEETGADPASETVEVPVRRLDTLLPELGIEHVDVLKIDVEGAEPAVVRGLLGGAVRPVVCVVEGEAPGLGRAAGDEAVRLLVEAGYTHCMFDGLNHYLTTDADLVEPLSVPASPVDGHVTDLVHRLLREREDFHRTIAALASDNLALRAATTGRSATPPSAASGTADTPGTPGTAATPVGDHGAGRTPPRAAGPSSAPTAVTEEPEFEGGDLPLPTDDTAGVDAGLAVATAALPDQPAAGPLGLPAPAPTLVPAATRRARRRATVLRLLAGPVPTLPVRPPGASARRIEPAALLGLPAADVVAQLYSTVLGRPADPEGLAAWAGRVDAGEHPLVVARALASSDEARHQPAPVRTAIEADLDRWAAQVALEDLGVSTHHPAALGRPGSLAHEIFVMALYEVALQRSPSDAELRFEADKLAAGTGREWLLRSYADRPEARARLLGRQPRGLRSTLRTWRDRRTYLEAFRTLVTAAESRQISRLLLDPSLGPASRGAGLPADLPEER